MLRPILFGSILLCLAPRSSGQSYGLLFGGGYNDLYAAGRVFGSGYGLFAGGFMPFYVNDRLVIRAEAGLAVVQTRPSEPEGTVSTPTVTSVKGALLGRYYVHKNVCLSLGAGYSQVMSEPPTISIGHLESTLATTDIQLLSGVAYRISKSMEIGLRVGQGLLPALDAGDHGSAHHRSASILLSHLIRSSKPGVVKRRNWRSDLGSVSRY